MTSISTAKAGAVRYIENEILPKLTGWARIGATGYVALVANNASNAVTELLNHPAIKLTGAVCGDEIDLDSVYSAFDGCFRERVTIPVPVLGDLVLSHDDYVTIFEYMRGNK